MNFAAVSDSDQVFAGRSNDERIIMMNSNVSVLSLCSV